MERFWEKAKPPGFKIGIFTLDCLFPREEPAKIVDSVYKKRGQFSLDRSSFFLSGHE